MSVAVLILAAGEQKCWEMTEPPYHKQLLDVGGETIIGRIHRQCQERGIEAVTVTSRPRTSPEYINWFAPRKKRWTVETLLSTQKLWLDLTIILLGDAVYSKATMNHIFAPHQNQLKVYGNEWEIYAVSFNAPYEKIITALKDAISHAESGIAKGGGKLRKFYQAYCGLNMTGNAIEWNVLRKVDDCTQDVDNPEDYAALLKKVKDGTLDDLEIK